MAATMRAKLQVGMVYKNRDGEGTVTSESLRMHGVCKNGYDETGLDEDNTFARFSPGVELNINIANPVLIGKFEVGQKFYVDFIPVEAAPLSPEQVTQAVAEANVAVG